MTMIYEEHSIELYEAMNLHRQVFPGQYVPVINKDLLPNPTQVGEYCSKEDFLSLPKWPSSWVHWKERCEKILEGDYFNIIPVHYEGIFTLLCNMVCPHCTRGKDRQLSNAFFPATIGNNRISALNTLPENMIKRVIDQLAELRIDNQMGIVWGGGDPTMNPATYECIKYAREKGVVSSFITNGVFIDVEKLFIAQPTLVRISLNCCDSEKYAEFHGIRKEWHYYDMVWDKIKEINIRKVNNENEMLFGISLIVDERNITDFTNTISHICNLIETYGKGIDYIIIRPVMKYHDVPSEVVHINKNTKGNIYNAMQPGSFVNNLLKKVNLPIIPIKDSFFAPPPEDYYSDKKECLAYGMCGEIRYNGDVQLCSDSYGNPHYTIGNIFKSSIKEILHSDKRKKILSEINANHCFQYNCPYNSRGHHLNRMFYQLEELRQLGKIDLAKKWIMDLREFTYPLYHSFFI